LACSEGIPWILCQCPPRCPTRCPSESVFSRGQCYDNYFGWFLPIFSRK
jgi:hypothetical protein